MKHDVVRSTVHNALDSITSGCSLAFSIHDYDFAFWQFVWSMPNGLLEVDLITGEISTPVPLKAQTAFRKLSQAFAIVATELPDFLRKHGCNPNVVRSIPVRFETNRINQQNVSVTIIRYDGRTSEDQYVGIPLRRRRTVDHLDRVRRS